MQTLIKPSAAIRQNYTEIANLCKETGEPVFLTKNGEGDLVVMDIAVYDQREKQLELREKLVEIEVGWHQTISWLEWHLGLTRK